jgi:hypothetical protein
MISFRKLIFASDKCVRCLARRRVVPNDPKDREAHHPAVALGGPRREFSRLGTTLRLTIACFWHTIHARLGREPGKKDR